jgi:uncharacterized protein (DUF1697 family)
MSNRQIALMRGINVGRAKRVAMADLRALLEEIGYGDVRTLLNSGNVVFTPSPRTTPKAAAAHIEEAIAKHLKVSARVTVLTAEELATAVANNPLLGFADNPTRLLVAVLFEPDYRTRLEPLVEQDWSPDVLALGKRVAYLWCSEGILVSRLAESFNRLIGEGTTTRNWGTILKLHALVKDQR